VQASGIERQDPRQDPRTTPNERAGEPPRVDGPGTRFGSVMQARKPLRAGGVAQESAALAAATRPATSFAPAAREISVRAAAPRPEIARLLVAPPHAPPEARIELRGGLFAGTSIHVVTAPGGVEVRLGAPTEAARLALASVIDRVGHHLRSRGIVMRPGASLDSGSRQQEREGRPRR
jgi:hypothetical protein